MSNFDHYPDMNRDGKRDSYDRAVFCDLMDEDERRSSGKNVRRYIDISWKEMLIICAIFSYEGALLKASIPVNGFTMILGIVLLIVLLCTIKITTIIE